MSWLSELFGGGGDEGPGERQWRIFREQEAARALMEQQLAAQQRISDQQLQYAREQEATRRGEYEAEQARLSEAAARQRAIEDAQRAEAERVQAETRAREEAERQRVAETAGLRTRSATALQSVLPAEFERQWAGAGLYEPTLESAYAANKARADEFINNMLKRGVITDVGAGAARGELEKQAPRVRSQLRDIGEQLIGAEQSKLADIRARGLGAAGGLELGQAFDPNVYGGQAQTEFQSFLKNLPSEFQARVTGDLFDVTPARQAAGGAQGALNLPFDPNVNLATTAAALASQQKPEDQIPLTPKQRLGSTAIF